MYITGTDNSLAIPSGLLIHAGLSPSFVAKFALFVAILLTWTVFCGKLGKKLLQLPIIAGQIIGGILLGPSLIDIAGIAFFARPISLFDPKTNLFYAITSSDLMVFFILLLSSAMTISYLLWIAGHETNIRDVLSIGITVISAGVFGAVFPIIMTAGFLYYVFAWTLLQSIALGLIFSATSVSIPIAMLFAYRKMHLKSSKATLGAAVVDDILAVIFLSIFFLMLQSGVFGIVKGLVISDPEKTIGVALVKMVLTFVFMGIAGFFFIPPFLRWLSRYHLSHLIAPAANSIMLFFFAFSELVGGLAGITGAYFAGLFHRMGDTRHRADKVILPFVTAILLPLFLGSIGLQIDLRLLSLFDWILVGILLIIAIISKLVGCWVATWFSNMVGRKGSYRWRAIDSYLFGSSMVARGEVGLVIATVLFGSRVLLPQQYVIAVVVIVLTTIAAPIMLAFGFNKLEIMPRGEEQLFALNIGLFPVVGTRQMFNIIIERIEASGIYRTSVRMSEGRKIFNVEGQNVKIILCPEEGILFRGDSAEIDEILSMVKRSVIEDVDRLSTH